MSRRDQWRGVIGGPGRQGRRSAAGAVGTAVRHRRGEGGGGRWLLRPWLLLAVDAARRRDGRHPGIDTAEGRGRVGGRRDPAGHAAVAAAHPVAVAGGGGEDRGDGGKRGGGEGAGRRGRR